MPHIQVDPPAVREKSPIPRRLIMAAMVEIQHSSTLNLEQMISDLMGKPGCRTIRSILVDQEPVLGLQTKNSMQHMFT
jgi:hypothetical protein